MKRVYLDHNATTPVHPEALEAMLPFFREKFGNPSSAHWAGAETAGPVREAREHVARLIGASPEEIVFTSGGSEGDNMALRGIAMRHGPGAHIVTSAIEHSAVLHTCEALMAMGYSYTAVRPNAYGVVEPEAVRAALRPETVLVSVMFANNETGSINPIREIAALARERGIAVHTDAVQAVGKMRVDVRELGVDLLSASGHKYNAPKGVGFQYVRQGFNKTVPQVTGGGQEGGHRAGTLNVPGIVALGKASEVALRDMDARYLKIGPLRERLERALFAEIPHSSLNGHPTLRVYNTVNLSIRYVESEALLMLLSKEGIAVSAGSACASASAEPSHVLSAMGLDAVGARGSLRLSVGLGTTEEDIDYALSVLLPLARRLQGMSPLAPQA